MIGIRRRRGQEVVLFGSRYSRGVDIPF